MWTKALMVVALVAGTPITAAVAKPKRSIGPVTLAMDAHRHMSVNGVAVTSDGLMAQLSRITSGDHGRPILLRLDPSLPYLQAVELMDRLQQEGYSQIALETGKP